MSAFPLNAPIKLRALTFTPSRDLFATSNGENAAITINKASGKGQAWIAMEVEGTGGSFHIVSRDNKAFGWTFTEPGVDLTLTDSPSLWSVNTIERNKMLIINIVAANGIIGATWYAGTAGNAVVIQAIPVIPDAPEAPRWEASAAL